ncbi:SBP1 (YHL034C) and RNP1 (YLL046C) [Zygosaccharomyces parabailii]|uniref:ZYBA0S04-05204g1_1 n=1 Tax=Zygosaccharomyces bailii (strain CLIB 213 / ATCC 58445 / CBS 680 / BCRC 21525 / NBRC 1098 / NCYC 1416 / NRRL Y-2227) TaxID=1333698 RepID=A0A8J2X7X0_ZYGB2|nr:SBP1 (YHL034C) and RNP1 (YLL046C) [Zygosaccharomyces parabailii]CDF89476.1 ZYBA0S04-05204g1_1 [Zygosaccharomyces bailii CLIB 213]SJM85935.1 related to Single-stranded nucleic acid-binding protein [Zygosaccharomyces bailii]
MSSEEVSNNNGSNSTTTAPKAVVDPETTIFVGNVSVEATEPDLKQLFVEEFGELVEVEIPAPAKTSRGRVLERRYAFVKFPSKIDVEAIKGKYDKSVVKDKGIFIRKALTEEERDAQRKSKRQQQQQRRKAKAGNFPKFRTAVSAPPIKEKPPLEEMERSTDTLYVNNIPYSATREELAEFFGTKPELIVLPMRRMRNTKTNKLFYSKKMNRGIAFVTFENLQGDIKSKVDEFQGKTLQDRPIVVDVAALRQPNNKEEETSESKQQQEQEQQQSKEDGEQSTEKEQSNKAESAD